MKLDQLSLCIAPTHKQTHISHAYSFIKKQFRRTARNKAGKRSNLDEQVEKAMEYSTLSSKVRQGQEG